NKKQRDEEVAQRGHFGGDVHRIWERRQRYAGDERAHFAGKFEKNSEFADEEAPGQGADQYQLRQARDAMKEKRQYESAHQQRNRDQDADTRNRHQDDLELQVVQAGLNRQEENREQILQDEHTQRDPPRQRIELALVVEQLDDNHGAAERDRDAKIERVPVAGGAERQPDRPEQGDPERTASEDLCRRRYHDHFPRPDDFLQVDFHADHEQHEDETQLSDCGD